MLLDTELRIKVNKTRTFLYSCPFRSKRFTLHSWQTCAFHRQLDFSRKHSATLQLLREGYSFTYPPLSIARYSCIQLVELKQRGVNEIAKASKRQQEDANPSSLD